MHSRTAHAAKPPRSGSCCGLGKFTEVPLRSPKLAKRNHWEQELTTSWPAVGTSVAAVPRQQRLLAGASSVETAIPLEWLRLLSCVS